MRVALEGVASQRPRPGPTPARICLTQLARGAIATYQIVVYSNWNL